MGGMRNRSDGWSKFLAMGCLVKVVKGVGQSESPLIREVGKKSHILWFILLTFN
jgi:hypothetical protein